MLAAWFLSVLRSLLHPGVFKPWPCLWPCTEPDTVIWFTVYELLPLECTIACVICELVLSN